MGWSVNPILNARHSRPALLSLQPNAHSYEDAGVNVDVVLKPNGEIVVGALLARQAELSSECIVLFL